MKLLRWIHSVQALLILNVLLSLDCSDKQTGDSSPEIRMVLDGLRDISNGTKTYELKGVVQLPPGWHTYWHNPGDAGLPPRFEPLVPNVQLGNPRLPIPEKIREETVITLGYHDRMPFVLDIHRTGEVDSPVAIRASLLICKEQCIPVSCTATVSIPRETATPDGSHTGMFGISDTTLKAVLQKTDTTVHISFHNEFSTEDAYKPVEMYPLSSGIVDLSARTRFILSEDTLSVELKRPQLAIEVPDTVSGLLVFKGPDGTRKGYEFTALSK